MAITQPFREFMLSQVREKDIALFEDLSKGEFDAQGPRQGRSALLIPAFMISELRRGFEIGFLIVLPFLVIDMIVATLTMSMGMMMLPPSVISLPVKILFFVLVDGWNLLVGSLVRSVELKPGGQPRARVQSFTGGMAPQTCGARRAIHEHDGHRRFRHAGRHQLAVVDFPERRQRQHHRLQERRDGICDASSIRSARPPASGGGVTTSVARSIRLQGTVVGTSTTTDLAVQGDGFFVVSDSSAATLYLTRNGSFVPDANGNLVNSRRLLPDGQTSRAASRARTRLSTLPRSMSTAAGADATTTDVWR